MVPCERLSWFSRTIKSEDFTEPQIRLCAMLAAYYSKGKDSSSVPVDYCLISQIKKVPGSKIGFVTMKSNKTFILTQMKIIY